MAVAYHCLTMWLAQSQVLWDDLGWDKNASRICVECAIRSLVHACSRNDLSLSNNIIKFETVVSDCSKACKIGPECAVEAMYFE